MLKKTVSMCFSIRKLPTTDTFKVRITDNALETVQYFKYLGIVLDSQLRFDKYIKKLGELLGPIFKPAGKSDTFFPSIQLVSAMILSHIA